MAPLWPPSSRALAATRRHYMAQRITVEACGTPSLPLRARRRRGRHTGTASNRAPHARARSPCPPPPAPSAGAGRARPAATAARRATAGARARRPTGRGRGDEAAEGGRGGLMSGRRSTAQASILPRRIRRLSGLLVAPPSRSAIGEYENIPPKTCGGGVGPTSEATSTVCTHRMPCRTRARGTRVPGEARWTRRPLQ